MFLEKDKFGLKQAKGLETKNVRKKVHIIFTSSFYWKKKEKKERPRRDTKFNIQDRESPG